MVVGTLTINLQVPSSKSLKDKRQVIRSLTARLRQTFNVAVAEVGDQDLWQAAVVGDDGTNDLLVSEVIRTNEMHVWFLSEHLVDTPLVGSEE